MNSAQMMSRPKPHNANAGSSNNGNGNVINALRKLYDPVLDEPIPQFLIDAASLTRQEAAAADMPDLAARQETPVAGEPAAPRDAAAEKPHNDGKA